MEAAAAVVYDAVEAQLSTLETKIRSLSHAASDKKQTARSILTNSKNSWMSSAKLKVMSSKATLQVERDLDSQCLSASANRLRSATKTDRLLFSSKQKQNLDGRHLLTKGGYSTAIVSSRIVTAKKPNSYITPEKPSNSRQKYWQSRKKGKSSGKLSLKTPQRTTKKTVLSSSGTKKHNYNRLIKENIILRKELRQLSKVKDQFQSLKQVLLNTLKGKKSNNHHKNK